MINSRRDADKIWDAKKLEMAHSERTRLEERVGARVSFLAIFVSASNFGLFTLYRDSERLAFLLILFVAFIMSFGLCISIVRTQNIFFNLISVLREKDPDHPYFGAADVAWPRFNAGRITGRYLPLFLMASYLFAFVAVLFPAVGKGLYP
jgi:hypothetical protein